MASDMIRPFVYPVGRDFAPRKKLVDEVPLQELLRKGLTRQISFYTTHTVCTHDDISQDEFFLWNPVVGIKIPCKQYMNIVPNRGNTAKLHREEMQDYFTLPEKLWHAFRESDWGKSGPLAEPWWLCSESQNPLSILVLDFELKIGKSVFEVIEKQFQHKQLTFNTLPLHLVHCWSYKNVELSSLQTGGPRNIATWEETPKPTPVTNIWKDFVVVRRYANRENLVIGVAGDFHCTERNGIVHENFPDSENINDKIKGFVKKVFNLWCNGELDYLVLNGDFIDYYLELRRNMPQTNLGLTDLDLWGAYLNHGYPYEVSNWQEFEKLVMFSPRLPDFSEEPKPTRESTLFQIPIIWNFGDCDRQNRGTPLPVKTDPRTYPYDNPVVHVDDPNLNEETQTYHYNYYGLDLNESQRINNQLGLGIQDQTWNPQFLWLYSSCPSHLRWVYEISRITGEPRTLTFLIGKRLFNLLLIDTGEVDLKWSQSNIKFGDVFRCTGTDNEIDLVSKNDFKIIFTHSPPFCLRPNDSRHAQNFSEIPPDDGQYGTFKNGREQLLESLGNRIDEGLPTLVVSSHVHYRSSYFLTSTSGGKRFIAGQHVQQKLDELNQDTRSEQFWRDNPCLEITLPPVGPRATQNEQSSGFLLLHLKEDGVTKILFQ